MHQSVVFHDNHRKIGIRRYIVKKLIIMLVALIAAVSSLSASDWHFWGKDLDQHPEILIGFCPTYLYGGVGYTGFEILPGHTTDIQLMAGAGYVQRKLFQDPETGESKFDLETGPIIYDLVQVDWALKLVQGFWDSPVEPGDDLLNITIAYEGKFEGAMDSMKVGAWRKNWENLPILTLDEYVGHDSSVYPDLKGNHQYLGTNLNLGFELDLMTDDIETNDGVLLNLDIDWAPLALNSALDGEADFYSIVFNAVGAKTLYQYQTGEKHWFSISLVDRFNINWTSGDMVPVYAQKQGSLGRKVRGYASYSYNSELTIVNNLDLRFTSPAIGVDGLYIRLNLFFDMGYGAGRFYNSEYRQDNQFIASTGAQITFTIFDFIDIGYQVAYLINGVNYAKGPSHFSSSFLFFLDF